MDDHPGILGMSSEQVTRLTGLSLRQLRYWDRTEFFSPEYAPGYPFGPFSRVYSFRDVVGLYTIALLRKDHRFPLQKLRTVGEYLHRNHETPWASLALAVRGRDILYRDPDHPESWVSSLQAPGQRALPIELAEVARRVEAEAKRLQRRQPAEIGRIRRNRYVVHNAPVLAGTRVPTSAVWNLHKAGYDARTILVEYPRLQLADVQAALEYEARRRRKAG